MRYSETRSRWREKAEIYCEYLLYSQFPGENMAATQHHSREVLALVRRQREKAQVWVSFFIVASRANSGHSKLRRFRIGQLCLKVVPYEVSVHCDCYSLWSILFTLRNVLIWMIYYMVHYLARSSPKGTERNSWTVESRMAGTRRIDL